MSFHFYNKSNTISRFSNFNYRGPYLLSSLRDFLADPGHEDIIGRLQRGEITLPRAAELMNTSTTNLSGLLD